MITLDTEQEMILATVREIVQDTIRPRAAEIDDQAEFPWDTVRIFSENGILGKCKPRS